MEDASRRRLAAWVLSIASLLVPALAAAAPPVFKCTVDGAVTYQHTPCAPAGERAASPTAQQLNAERQKKLRQAASAASASSPPPERPKPPAEGRASAPTAPRR